MSENTKYLYVLEDYLSIGELLGFFSRNFPKGEFLYVDKKSSRARIPKKIPLSVFSDFVSGISDELEGLKLYDVWVYLNDPGKGLVFFGEFDPQSDIGASPCNVLTRQVLSFDVTFRGVSPPRGLLRVSLEDMAGGRPADPEFQRHLNQSKACLEVARSVFSAVVPASLCIVVQEYLLDELFMYLRGDGDISLNKRNVPSVLMLELEDLEELTKVYLDARFSGDRSPFHLYDCVGDCFSSEPSKVMVDALEKMNSIAKGICSDSDDIKFGDVRCSVEEYVKLIEDDMPDCWRSYMRNVRAGNAD